jgi:hypothetical protein
MEGCAVDGHHPDILVVLVADYLIQAPEITAFIPQPGWVTKRSPIICR